MGAYKKEERDAFRRERENVMDKWDGLSSTSLATQVDAYLAFHGEPTVAALMEAVAGVDAACASFPDGMRPVWTSTGEEMLDPPHDGARHRELLNSLTCRNFVAVCGYLPLVRWFVETKGSTVEQVTRMLYLNVKGTPYSKTDHVGGATSAETQAYLLQWLQSNGGDVASARFDSHDYNDDGNQRRDPVLEGEPEWVTLLDTVVDHAVVSVPLYRIYSKEDDEPLASRLERCWACIELLQARVPECELTCFDKCLGSMGSHIRWRAGEDHRVVHGA
jgi:hypothetical protein